jgi:SAM-dependent methyltransferase
MRNLLPLLAAMTVLSVGLELCAVMVLFAAFGHLQSIMVMAVAQCSHVLTTIVLFAPNATGVPYAAAAYALKQLGDVPYAITAAAAPVMMTTNSIVFWSSFSVGATQLRRRPTEEAQAMMDAAPDRQAALFDRLAAKGKLYDYGEEALRTVDGLVEDKGGVLDIGCGDGALTAGLDARFAAGVELSPRCAEIALSRGVPCVLADGRKGLPFASDSFDTVYCIGALHHMEGEWPAMLREAVRALRPGGQLAVLEPDARNLFVRWTQAPRSPIRVAPHDNEPALYPGEVLSELEALGFACECRPLHLEGAQEERGVFPLWQRVLKAPFVLILGFIYRNKPNKFAITARRTAACAPSQSHEREAAARAAMRKCEEDSPCRLKARRRS